MMTLEFDSSRNEHGSDMQSDSTAVETFIDLVARLIARHHCRVPPDGVERASLPTVQADVKGTRSPRGRIGSQTKRVPRNQITNCCHDGLKPNQRQPR